MIARLTALLVITSLTGCADTRPGTGALVPTTTIRQAAELTMRAATTRARDPGPAMFSEYRLGPREVDFASVTVSIPPTHVAGEIQWPAEAPGDRFHDGGPRLSDAGRISRPARCWAAGAAGGEPGRAALHPRLQHLFRRRHLPLGPVCPRCRL